MSPVASVPPVWTATLALPVVLALATLLAVSGGGEGVRGVDWQRETLASPRRATTPAETWIAVM